MIDNFDRLVERCNTIRRRRMIRFSLILTSIFITLVAIAAAFYLYWINQTVQNLTPSQTSMKKSISKPVQEHNLSDNIPLAVPVKLTIPIAANYTLPPKDNTKTRAYVIQLTSNRTFSDANISRRKVPLQYHSSLAIFYVNGYYTLRYIDIYERESLPHMIAYFQSLGFNQPTAYKYDPNRIPMTSDTLSKNTVTAPSQETPSLQPAVAPITPSREHTRLFSVQTTSKTSTADLIKTFNTNPNYDIALRLANDFYAQNNFDDAALWAKKANQLNREAEEAWLLYAKSYYSQGKKSEAISVLELYLNYKDSRAASKLLRSWKQTPTGEPL